MKKSANSFFVVFGSSIETNWGNVKTINTYIIPNIGDQVFLNDQVYRVKDKLISYKMVDGYDLNDEGRGGELIYIFV